VAARAPLANGYLSGKYRPGAGITAGGDGAWAVTAELQTAAVRRRHFTTR
jgi:aryl-alcohol dehydrogenase-like predicted oxidoreductase